MAAYVASWPAKPLMLTFSGALQKKIANLWSKDLTILEERDRHKQVKANLSFISEASYTSMCGPGPPILGHLEPHPVDADFWAWWFCPFNKAS